MKPRYRLRKVGTKFDAVPRYKIMDTERNVRVDGVPGGLAKEQAQDTADDLNDVNGNFR